MLAIPLAANASSWSLMNRQATLVAIDLGVTSVDIALCDLGASILRTPGAPDVRVSDGPRRSWPELWAWLMRS